MSKPDEISQAAWDEGMKEARFYADWLHAGNSSGSVSPHAVTALADTIARAILSAEKRGEEREREACALVAVCQFDDRGNGRSGHPSQMDWEDGYRDATRAAAAAIRKRGA